MGIVKHGQGEVLPPDEDTPYHQQALWTVEDEKELDEESREE